MLGRGLSGVGRIGSPHPGRIRHQAGTGVRSEDDAPTTNQKYVRQGAAGSADGSDWTNAYTTLPATLTRDTTYWIADGSYSGYTFNDTASGSLVIRVKKATGSLHGTDTGWSSGYGDGQATFGAFDIQTDYWTIDGSVGGGPGSWDSGHGFKITSTGDTTPVIIMGFSSATADNVILRHIEFEGKGSVSNGGGSLANDAIAGFNVDNLHVSHFWTHGIGRCPFFFDGNENTVIQYGLVDDYYGQESQHSALISSGQSYTGDTTFRYNLVRDCQSTGGIMWDNNTNASAVFRCYGNVFDFTDNNATVTGNNGVIGGWFGGNGEEFHNMLVYNNSFVNVPLLGEVGACLGEIPQTFSGCQAKNNLFYNCDEPGGGGPWTTKTHNHFISTSTIGTNTSTGSGDPFVSIAGNNYHLTANTSSGENLGAPYNVDMYGATRSTWTRGAVEY